MPPATVVFGALKKARRYKTQKGAFLLQIFSNAGKTPGNQVRTARGLFYYNISMWKTILLLTASNLFMTVAWYGHLKHKDKALWLVILASWGIAFFEYCLQVPANRIGSGYFTVTQLKVMQEVITLSVFTGFSVLYFKETFKWNHLAGFLCLVAAVFFIFKKW